MNTCFIQKHEDLKFLQIGLVMIYKRHPTKMCHTKGLLSQYFFRDYECGFGTMMEKILKSTKQSLIHNHSHFPFFTNLMPGYGSYEHILLLCEF